MRLVGQSSEAENQEFFVSNPQPVCVSDFFQDVAHFLGVRYEPYVLSEARIKRIQKRCYRERPDDLVMRILFEDYFVCRSKKLYETINCQPTTGYRRGLEETVRWYQEHVFHSHNFIN
jgi:nucleoside-diphosphate-sugar epimerase